MSEIGTIYDGPHATPQRMQDGPYFLNIASLDNGRLDLAQSDHVSEADFSTWTRRVVPQENDLLFSYETRLGEAALMPAGVRACLGRRMALLRPDTSVVDPRFLLYRYLSPQFQALIEQNTIHGATVNRIGLATMGKWAIELPELRQQAAVAEVLAALDDKIAANERVVTTSVKLIGYHVDAMCLDDVADQNQTIKLDELFELNPFVRSPDEDEPVYVAMQDLPTSGMTLSSWSHRRAKGGARFQNGDTLLARITPCLENRKTGFVDFLPDHAVGLGSTEYIVLRSRDGVPAALSYFVAVSERFREFAIRHMIGTSGRQRVAAKDLLGYKLARPDPADLAELGATARPLLGVMASLRDENRQLAQLRDALLPELMSGRLRIRDAEKQVEAVV